MITRKKLLIAGGVLVGIVFIIILYKFTVNTKDLAVPVESLKQLDKNLSDSKIKKINNNYYDILEEYEFSDDDLLYFTTAFNYDDSKYTGRFVNDSYTYQFIIDVNTNKVEIIEISKRQIDIEELESDNG